MYHNIGPHLNKSNLRYWTKRGAEQLGNDINRLCDEYFLFSKDSNKKSRLLTVQILPCGPLGGFGINLISHDFISIPIYDFVTINPIAGYKFENYEFFSA